MSSHPAEPPARVGGPIGVPVPADATEEQRIEAIERQVRSWRRMRWRGGTRPGSGLTDEARAALTDEVSLASFPAERAVLVRTWEDPSGADRTRASGVLYDVRGLAENGLEKVFDPRNAEQRTDAGGRRVIIYRDPARRPVSHDELVRVSDLLREMLNKPEARRKTTRDEVASGDEDGETPWNPPKRDPNPLFRIAFGREDGFQVVASTAGTASSMLALMLKEMDRYGGRRNISDPSILIDPTLGDGETIARFRGFELPTRGINRYGRMIRDRKRSESEMLRLERTYGESVVVQVWLRWAKNIRNAVPALQRAIGDRLRGKEVRILVCEDPFFFDSGQRSHGFMLSINGEDLFVKEDRQPLAFRAKQDTFYIDLGYHTWSSNDVLQGEFLGEDDRSEVLRRIVKTLRDASLEFKADPNGRIMIAALEKAERIRRVMRNLDF